MVERITETMVEAVARAIEPETFEKPRINLYADLYERAFSRARRAIEAVAALATEPGEAEGWREMPAPILERVIVAGWQRRHGTTAAYWWYHEDATDDVGRPIERPDAMLWVRLTDVLPQFPAAPTSEGSHHG